MLFCLYSYVLAFRIMCENKFIYVVTVETFSSLALLFVFILSFYTYTVFFVITVYLYTCNIIIFELNIYYFVGESLDNRIGFKSYQNF